jgi:YidC/Oxa1 family membrane protein insertase
MDRKAWIVVTLCVIGMAVNMYFSTQNAAKKAEAEAEAKKAAAEQAAAEPETATTPVTGDTAKTAPSTAAKPAVMSAPAEEKTHTVSANGVDYVFSTRGGGVKVARLSTHDHVILNERGKEAVGSLRREAGGIDPITYAVESKSGTGITFTGTSAEGIQVTKDWKLSDGEISDPHLLNLTVTLTNTGEAQHRSEEYYLYSGVAASLRPDEIRKPGVFWNDAGNADFKDTGWFKGGWFSSAKSEFRENYSELRYAGVMSRFYAHILSPANEDEAAAKVWARSVPIDHSQDEFADSSAGKSDLGVEGSLGLPVVDLAPGASKTIEYEVYLGPKEYHRLRDIEDQRRFVMFYGWFSPISRLLNNVMRWMHDVSGNWGIAIILLTIFVRICLWPIHAKSTYTMKRMSLLAPKMKELQEKYKDEPQKQQAEVMKLYKDYGVNPLGGCLPMFLQIPIFFGFYRVLENAAELRGQDFLWVKDLSSPDTVAQIASFDVNPLPLIMGLTMFLQMKLTPQAPTADKMQQRIFMIMPVFFLFICYNFASALALYWSTQNVFSILQTRLMRLYQGEPTLEKIKKKAAAKPEPTQNPFFNPMGPKKDKKPKNRPPKLGG